MKLHSTCFVLLLLALCCCNRNRPSNLKLPEAEKQSIKQNRVDTTYIFYPQSNGSEIKTYQTYDENGQVIYDNTSMVDEVRYFYDKRGLLIKKEWNWLRNSLIMIDTMIYDFDDDNRIRSVKWLDRQKGDGFKYNDRGREEKFTYDDRGQMIEKIEIRNYASGPSKTRTTYLFEGELLKRVSFFRSNSSALSAETFYYYSSQGQLDSTVMKLAYGDRSSFRSVYKNGLIVQDFHGNNPSGKLYVHVTRK